MTVVPGQAGTAGVGDISGPDEADGALLVNGLLVGVCGTDREIADGGYGEAAMVLRNVELFGTVNAGRRHWDAAAGALAATDPAWFDLAA